MKRKPDFSLPELDGDDFILGLNHTKRDFNRDELMVLRRRGKWLHALMHKLAPPIGNEQRHFVEVFVNGAEPQTKLEKLWAKYQSALKSEEEIRRLRVEETQSSDRYRLHASRNQVT